MSEDKRTEEEVIEDLTIEDLSAPADSTGKSWADLEAEYESGTADEEIAPVIPSPKQSFYLSKEEIAELAFDASLGLRDLVEQHEEAGEHITHFSDLPDEERKEWAEVAKLALDLQGDPDDSNFARLVHAKTAMGLLKNGVCFDEKFSQDKTYGKISSPLVAPWECLPFERRAPLKIFKAMCRSLYELWDRDNEILKR